MSASGLQEPSGDETGRTAQARRVLGLTLAQVRREEPELWQMLEAMVPVWPEAEAPLELLLTRLDPALLRENGVDARMVRECIADFYAHLPGAAAQEGVERLTVVGGRGKDGAAEGVTLELRRGEVACLVGPTGAGKSRLLADLECLAQGDTPTGRRVLLDGAPPADEVRFSGERKLVAQLTQNMNFVMDLPAEEFLILHARSRLKPQPQELALEVLRQANALAGESFAPSTPLTGLSGGQSRALMIADTALICDSPVVLIDEIENAGVDRRKALDLLVRRNKIVLLATHDPVLALLAEVRINVRDGAIRQIHRTTDAERTLLRELLAHDERLGALRAALRRGDPIDGCA